MPIPESPTRMATSRSRCSTARLIRPPRGVYLAALISRFVRICSSRVGSAFKKTGSWGMEDLQLVMLIVEKRADCLDGLGDHRGQIHIFLVEVDSPPADPRDVEKIIDQPPEVVDLALDHRQFAPGPMAIRPGLLQQVDGRLDRGQRIAQLVREDGQEFFLAAIRLAEFFLGVLAAGDVGEHPEDADHHSLVVLVRARGDDRPQLPTVGAAKAQVVDVGLALTPLFQFCRHQRSIVRGHEVEHRSAVQIGEWNLQHLGETGVGESDCPLRVEDPDAFESRLDDPSESLLALADSDLGDGDDQ